MSVIRLFARIFSGRVHFSRLHSGKILLMEDGREFQIFRHLQVDPGKSSQGPPAVFKVSFKFSGLSGRMNKRLSMIPAPFLTGRSGFLQKIWSVNEEGYFQGIYQWDSAESANHYPQSFIFKLMTKRSVKGTVSYDVLPDTNLSDYIARLIQK